MTYSNSNIKVGKNKNNFVGVCIETKTSNSLCSLLYVKRKKNYSSL